MRESKLMALRRLYRMKTPHANSKSQALQIHKARVHKKKMPQVTRTENKSDDYKKMSIADFEAKYL